MGFSSGKRFHNFLRILKGVCEHKYSNFADMETGQVTYTPEDLKVTPLGPDKSGLDPRSLDS